MLDTIILSIKTFGAFSLSICLIYPVIIQSSVAAHDAPFVVISVSFLLESIVSFGKSLFVASCTQADQTPLVKLLKKYLGSPAGTKSCEAYKKGSFPFTHSDPAEAVGLFVVPDDVHQ